MRGCDSAPPRIEANTMPAFCWVDYTRRGPGAATYQTADPGPQRWQPSRLGSHTTIGVSGETPATSLVWNQEGPTGGLFGDTGRRRTCALYSLVAIEGIREIHPRSHLGAAARTTPRCRCQESDLRLDLANPCIGSSPDLVLAIQRTSRTATIHKLGLGRNEQETSQPPTLGGGPTCSPRTNKNHHREG